MQITMLTYVAVYNGFKSSQQNKHNEGVSLKIMGVYGKMHVHYKLHNIPLGWELLIIYSIFARSTSINISIHKNCKQTRRNHSTLALHAIRGKKPNVCMKWLTMYI